MKISKKLWKQVLNEVNLGADDVAAYHIEDLSIRPPEDWNDREKLIFDIAHEVEMKVAARLKEVFGAK